MNEQRETSNEKRATSNEQQAIIHVIGKGPTAYEYFQHHQPHHKIITVNAAPTQHPANLTVLIDHPQLHGIEQINEYIDNPLLSNFVVTNLTAWSAVFHRYSDKNLFQIEAVTTYEDKPVILDITHNIYSSFGSSSFIAAQLAFKEYKLQYKEFNILLSGVDFTADHTTAYKRDLIKTNFIRLMQQLKLHKVNLFVTSEKSYLFPEIPLYTEPREASNEQRATRNEPREASHEQPETSNN
jgi:hypothetical protein